MASDHTPTPWVIDRDNRPGMDWNNHITGANYRTICAMFHDGTEDNLTGEANAALIVAAVNAYRPMVTALRDLIAVCDRNIYPKPDAGPDHPWSVLQRARAALEAQS